MEKKIRKVNLQRVREKIRKKSYIQAGHVEEKEEESLYTSVSRREKIRIELKNVKNYKERLNQSVSG